MAWFRIDDNFYDHPKVDELPLAAIGLWTVCGTYAARHLTDGFIPHRRVTRLGGTDDLVDALVDAELWDRTEGGFMFRNWMDYQPTKTEVESSREKARQRQRRKRERDAQGRYVKEGEPVTPMSRRDTPVTNAVSHAPVTASVTPSPVNPAWRDGEMHPDRVTAPADLENPAPTPVTVTENDHNPTTQPELLEIDETGADVTQMSRRDTPRDSRSSHAVSHSTPVPSRPDPSIHSLSSHAASGGDVEVAPKPEPEFSEDVTGLADHLADWIVRNGNRKPRVTKTWHQAIDRLIRIDGYTPDNIRQVIDWCQQDEFWQGNILSAAKLRKQFDQLKNRMFQQQNRTARRNPVLAPGSERAMNTLKLGQALQATIDNPQEL